jgi:beta-N-acetylhexosaminidase
MKYYRLFVLLAILQIAFNQVKAFEQYKISQPKIDTLKQTNWVDSLMKSLTIREKIAQSFMVSAYSNKDQKHIDDISLLVKNEKIGGLIFFQGGPVRQAKLTNYYQSLSKVPIIVSIDGEWGLGMRLDSTFSYPRQMMLGAGYDSLLVYQVASDMAMHFKRMGIHINYGPVVDINNNPLNPVIGSRSFGENKTIVSRFGLEYMRGLQDNGILACAKHFPGHGDTDADSHLALPKVKQTIERLDSLELYPFSILINNGVAGVMVAHLCVPALENDTTLASSISPKVIKKTLVDSLKFKGLIFTDALNMKGVADFHKPVELNYLAYKAGNDFLTCPEKIKESIDFIENEVKKGTLSEEEVNLKCRKILNAKYVVGLSSYKPIDINNLVSDLNNSKSEILRRKVIEQGITLLKGNSLLPLKRLDTLKIAYVEIGKGKGQSFLNQLEMYTAITTFSINPESNLILYDSLLTALDPFNLIIIGCHSIEIKAAKNYGLTSQASNFIFDLSFRKRVIVDIFGNPYSLNRLMNLPSMGALIISFDNSNIVQNLSAQMIFGGIGVRGKLPVSATNSIPIGSGHYNGEIIRLKYSIPEELGIDSKELECVDSIALDIIAKQITPGMQILAAKDGIVFYNKSFGSFTYSNEVPVDFNSIYDIASVTKVTATLPSVMHLFEKDSINLQKTVDKYINLSDGSNKKKLVISDLLLHQSGLQPWLPFYVSTISTLTPGKAPLSSTFSSDYPYMAYENMFVNKHSSPNPIYFSNKRSDNFPYQVAENMYSCKGIKDTILSKMNSTELKDIGKYKYSDLGFLYLQKIIETITKKDLDDYTNQKFYSHLGMNNTSYLPLKKFDCSRIVPTEEDLFYRKQLLIGYVHDPTAALIGGVAGHAGVFSTANDLAKLMQMYIQKGIYGGERFFLPQTIDFFTSTHKNSNGNRRALGFDKPETKEGKPSPAGASASNLSFGHSGFTGTMVWADPDNGLIFIFLSNRVYPDASTNRMAELNIRTNIQEIFYKAIKKGKRNITTP